jgi:acyl carrier protein
MSGEAIRQVVRSFLSKTFNTETLSDDADIFALGFVTSLFAMQLVEFLESEFRIAIQSEDLEIENFQSISAVGRFVERKAALTSAA